MCLNHSVITGKCSGCAAYKAQVARLEEELAIRKGAQARLGEEWEYEQDRANDAEAANAALAAAGRVVLDQRANMAGLDAVYSLDEALGGLRATLDALKETSPPG